MSRVMYSYRVPKDAWWGFANDCRQFYAEEHPFAGVVTRVSRHASTLPPEEKSAKLVSFLGAINQLGEWMVDLQLFDEGDTFIVRPLERGYFFRNHYARWESFGLEPIFYDDRSDVPPDQEPNRAVSLWCDDKIARGEYLLYQVVTEDSLSSALLDALTS